MSNISRLYYLLPICQFILVLCFCNEMRREENKIEQKKKKTADKLPNIFGSTKRNQLQLTNSSSSSTCQILINEIFTCFDIVLMYNPNQNVQLDTKEKKREKNSQCNREIHSTQYIHLNQTSTMYQNLNFCCFNYSLSHQALLAAFDIGQIPAPILLDSPMNI